MLEVIDGCYGFTQVVIYIALKPRVWCSQGF